MGEPGTLPQVLITRPAAQAENFQKLCHDAGFTSVSLPCIEIEFLDASLSLSALQRTDQVLFTSANAVEGARRQLPFPWSDVSVVAIGPATERALSKAGQTVTHSAQPPYNSEAFIERLRTDGVPGTLSIIKGEGGREWLIDTLQDEGVCVTPKDVYRRTLPSIDDETRKAVFDTAPIDIISVTSDEVLKNLLEIAGDRYRHTLLSLPLVCNSQRCAELAATLGFSISAQVAAQPGDAGQLEQLHQWKHAWINSSASEI